MIFHFIISYLPKFLSPIHRSFTRVGLSKATPLNVFPPRELPPWGMVSHRDKWSPTWGMACHRGNDWFPTVWNRFSMSSPLLDPVYISRPEKFASNSKRKCSWKPCTIFISIVVHMNHLENFESIKTIVEALCDNATTSYAGQWTRRNHNHVFAH